MSVMLNWLERNSGAVVVVWTVTCATVALLFL